MLSIRTHLTAAHCAQFLLTTSAKQTATLLATVLQPGCNTGVQPPVLIARRDLENKLNLTAALLRGVVVVAAAGDVNKVRNKVAQSSRLGDSSFMVEVEQSALDVCMDSVGHIIEKIHLHLKHIHAAVQAHQDKWFNVWRQVDYGEHLTNLEVHT